MAVVGLAVRADPAGAVASFVLRTTGMVAGPVSAVALAAAIGGVASQDRRAALLGAFGAGFATLVGDGASLANWRIQARLRERTMHALDLRLMALVGGVPGIEHLERPDYADKIELLRGQRGAIGGAIDQIVWLASSLIQFALSALILASVSPWLLLVGLFGVPAVAASAQVTTALQNRRDEDAEDRRLLSHYRTLTLSADIAGEIRAFGLADELIARHESVWTRTYGHWRRVALRGQVSRTAGWLVFAIGYLGAVALVAARVLRGQASPADMVVTLTLAADIRDQIAGLARMSATLVDNLRAVDRYLWLIDEADQSRARTNVTDPFPAPTRLNQGIALDAVSFRYPGTEHDVLRDITIDLPAGSTVAIVGDNGAGKTTLVKLLARLYEPTAGIIAADGIALSQVAIEDWRARTSACFQDYARPELIAREAVGIGHVPALTEESAVHTALTRASANDVVADLPRGLDTQLGRSFDEGVDISGGQWQRLALARGMMRSEPLLLLLDEPTAALDAKTEHSLFERFADAAHRAASTTGAITVLVSHRFSTVRMADLIIVLSDGRLIEAGSHSELIARGGTYAELYELQARSYR
jgi:ATP-binding cassette subfamily B protein